MPLLLVVLDFSSIESGASALSVEVEVDRLPRLFFRGPRWVSLNSVLQSVSTLSNAQGKRFTLGQIPRHGSSCVGLGRESGSDAYIRESGYNNARCGEPTSPPKVEY